MNVKVLTPNYKNGEIIFDCISFQTKRKILEDGSVSKDIEIVIEGFKKDVENKETGKKGDVLIIKIFSSEDYDKLDIDHEWFGLNSKFAVYQHKIKEIKE